LKATVLEAHVIVGYVDSAGICMRKDPHSRLHNWGTSGDVLLELLTTEFWVLFRRIKDLSFDWHILNTFLYLFDRNIPTLE